MGDDQERREKAKSSLNRRMGAQKLAALALVSSEEELRRFRKQRLRGADAIADGELELMRDVLVALAELLESHDPEGWQRLQRAWRALAPQEEEPAERDEPADADSEPADHHGPRAPKRIDELDEDGDDDRPAPLAAATPSSPWTTFTGAAAAPRPSSPDAAGGADASPPPPEPSWTTTQPEDGPAPARPEFPRAGADDTRTLTAHEIELEPAVPFERGSGPGVPPAAASSPAIRPAAGERPSPPAKSPWARPAVEEKTAPLSYTSDAHGLALTLREYAGLCAERELYPEKSREIYERYDVHGEAVKRALDRLYERRFQLSPSLRSRFEQQRVRFLYRLRHPNR